MQIPVSHLQAALEFSALRDIRYYLNAFFVDASAGCLVSTDGHSAYIGRPGSVSDAGYDVLIHRDNVK